MFTHSLHLRQNALAPSDFALVGEIAVEIERSDPGRPDAVLRLLASRVGADVAELFLVAPGMGEMVRVAHQGSDEDAFAQLDRFPRGQGFPGVVLDTASAISTTTLESEADFLRSRVKRRGYHCALCVPIHCGVRVGGCLLVAWRRRLPALDRCVRQVSLASIPLGTALSVPPGSTGADGTGLAGLAALEARLREATVCDEARVVREPDAACPAMVSGQAQVLGGRTGWSPACIRSDCVCRARYCIPLKRANGDAWGVATVSYGHDSPEPLTRWFPTTLRVTDEFARHPSLEPSGGPSDFEDEPAGKARLTVCCLGGFEVRLEGRRLSYDAFTRRKALELLARLVVAGGRPEPLEDLASDLWPDADQHRLSNRFHVTLSALRNVIEPESGGPRGWRHVRSEAGRYFLDPESPVYVDLWHADALLRRTVSARPYAPASGQRALLHRVAQLCRGTPFHGVFCTDWSRRAARRWHDRLARTLDGSGGSAPSPAVATFRAARDPALLQPSIERP